MSIVAALDKVLFFNASSKYSVLRMKTEDSSVPAEARSPYRYHDHLIRFTAVGIELPRDTRSQVHEGTRVSKQDLVEGDLVFFKINRRLNHVGIYVGNGEFIHASTRAGVTRSKLDNSYWRSKFWQARRIEI